MHDDPLDEAEFVISDTPAATHKLSLSVEQVRVQIDQARSLREIAKSLELIAEIMDAKS